MTRKTNLIIAFICVPESSENIIPWTAILIIHINQVGMKQKNTVCSSLNTMLFFLYYALVND